MSTLTAPSPQGIGTTRSQPKQGRVLCVDDEPNVLRSLKWLLQRDFEVTTAPSGGAALPLLPTGDFDVVISDQRMPGMMGSEFLQEVRRCSPRSMRILLTGYSDMQAVLRSVNESEIFRFINKPWNIEELPKVVAQAAEIARRHAAEGTAEPAGEPAPAAAADVADSVLVIDDDAAVVSQLEEVLGANRPVVHARSLAAAVTALDAGQIGIIVADTHVGGVDTTLLLKMLKRDFPQIVTVVLTEATDAVDVITLINHGQIFRFLPKPIKPTMLRMALSAAQMKRARLKSCPDLAARHAVAELGEARQEQLLAQIRRAVVALQHRQGERDATLLDRLGSSLKRLFRLH